ncbi:MAG: AIR synthase-related protein, partial [Trichodesmium sp. MAG_R03]|nr:AIR synthase-related protein [Trichodesmium sp. MAG_R03]
AIYPTPVVGMVGLVPDITRICGQGWQTEGDVIYLIGNLVGSSLAGSEYLATIHNVVAGKPTEVDFDLERRVQAVCRHGIRQGWVRSAHDSAEGGLAIALSECCISGKSGAKIIWEFSDVSNFRWDEFLFGEGGCRILVSIAPENQIIWESYLQENLTYFWQKIGLVGNAESGLQILVNEVMSLINIDIGEISDRFKGAIERRLSF